MSERLTKCGDVIVDSVVIRKVDQSNQSTMLNVLPQLISLEICENIFEPFLSGSIVLNDGQNITNVLPLIGVEIITITFHTPTIESQYYYSKDFIVTNISDKIKVNGRVNAYRLDIMSVEVLIDRNVKISKTYRGTPSDIIEQLVHQQGLQSLKPVWIEPTSNQITFISNMWNPIKCIDYVVNNALNAQGNCNYLFFENRSGFNFVALDQLCGSQSIQQFRSNDYALSPASNSDSTTTFNLDLGYQTVNQYNIHDSFNLFQRLQSGYYGGEVIAWDVTTQQYSHTAISSLIDNKNRIRLNQYSPVPVTFPTMTQCNLNYSPYTTQTFEGQNKGVLDSNVTYMLQRQQFLSQLSTTIINIEVWGRSDYTVGTVVEFTLPKNQRIDNQQQKFDLLNSGRYIIAACRHIIAGGEHTCQMQLMKDSYITDIN